MKNETDALASINPKPLSFKDEMQSREDEQEAPEDRASDGTKKVGGPNFDEILVRLYREFKTIK